MTGLREIKWRLIGETDEVSDTNQTDTKVGEGHSHHIEQDDPKWPTISETRWSSLIRFLYRELRKESTLYIFAGNFVLELWLKSWYNGSYVPQTHAITGVCCWQEILGWHNWKYLQSSLTDPTTAVFLTSGVMKAVPDKKCQPTHLRSPRWYV